MNKTDMTVTQAIADLAWAINSPGLIDLSAADSNLWSPLDPKRIDQNHLLEFLASNPTKRVGRYFETLVLYFLQYVQNYEIVASGQPIVVDRRTVGEIDFLYRDHAGVLTHLEVAVKFYFHLPGQPYNGSHYVGPNVSDSFERKTRRLIDHQLPLSQIHHPEVNRRIGLMKGRIYYQADLKAQPEYPDLMSTDHLRGRWTYASEVAELERFRADSFLVLRKPHWLTFDPNSESLNRLQIQKVIKDHFTHRKFPIHIAIVREGIEIERLFVVADTWPDD